MKSPRLEAVEVGFSYDGGFRLGPLSLSLGAGDVLVLTGDNGSGKTTLLKLLAGQIRPSTGQIKSGFEPDKGAARSGYVAMVPQKEVPVAGFTVSEVVSWGLLADRNRSVFEVDPVTRAITMVGLDGLEGAHCGALSGGQYQRVTLARALASGAKVVLMDEPSANIDAGSTARLAETVGDLAGTGTSFVIATHDARLVSALGRKPMNLSDGRFDG